MLDDLLMLDDNWSAWKDGPGGRRGKDRMEVVDRACQRYC